MSQKKKRATLLSVHGNSGGREERVREREEGKLLCFFKSNQIKPKPIILVPNWVGESEIKPVSGYPFSVAHVGFWVWTFKHASTPISKVTTTTQI